MLFGLSSTVRRSLVQSIMADTETWSQCLQLSEQKSLPPDEVANDLAQLMVTRVSHYRKGNRSYFGQKQLNNLNQELKKFQEKYGLSYQQSTVLSDEIVKEYNATTRTPLQQLERVLKPCFRIFISFMPTTASLVLQYAFGVSASNRLE